MQTIILLILAVYGQDEQCIWPRIFNGEKMPIDKTCRSVSQNASFALPLYQCITQESNTTSISWKYTCDSNDQVNLLNWTSNGNCMGDDYTNTTNPPDIIGNGCNRTQNCSFASYYILLNKY